MQAEFAQAIRLMEQLGRIDENLADTLRAMAAADKSEAAARRLELAKAAVKGAHEAAERSKQLQRQADRWARQAEVVDLFQSLRYAGTMLADLARTERDIADTLMSLASRGGSDRAAQLLPLAEEAVAGVQRANDRAQALHDLAVSVARKNDQGAGAPQPRGRRCGTPLGTRPGERSSRWQPPCSCLTC